MKGKSIYFLYKKGQLNYLSVSSNHLVCLCPTELIEK